MPIDYSLLGGTNLVDTATDPIKLFNALPRPGGPAYPRNVQDEVLKNWYARRNERDLVLKMNTGAGKTIVGLLILKSSLNEKAGPAAYITPDTYLADQVIAEAARLGIEITRDIDQRYLTGKAILVHNIHKIVNGKSKFGVEDSTPLGTVVIDDAHSCLRTAEGQFTIELSQNHDAYKELFPLFKPSLDEQSMVTVLDIVEGDPAKALVVPYWAWRDKQVFVASILHKYRNAEELLWPWPLVKDALPNCTAIFSGRGLTISSRCLNIQLIRDFENAKRRIYMTATLADDSALITHFRAGENAVKKPVTPSSGGDLGDRMILVPQELNPHIDDDQVKAFVAWAGRQWNVVVIVPSAKRAKHWQDVAAQTLTAGDLTRGVAAMRSGKVGVTVLVNKYDGVDLPNDACRILVIDGLPEIDRPLDKADANVLEDSDAMLAKHVQRIEQGMGRGIRSNDDHCVVLLLGNRLVRRLAAPAAESKFTPATLAQLELSRKVAEQLKGKSLNDIYSDAMVPCLTQDNKWVSVSRAVVAASDFGASPPVDVSTAVRLRAAFDAALLDRYGDAQAEIRAALEEEKDPRVVGWLLQQLADYTHPTDPSRAQAIQASAQKSNRLVLKPLLGVDYVRLTASRPQAEALAEFLRQTYKDPISMVQGYNAILEELVFQSSSFRRFEAAVNDLGTHLGFAAHRPEVEFGKGPDNLWGFGGTRFAIIECKNEATAAFISKDYVDKSSGRRYWFAEQYGPGCAAASVMVHPSNVVSRLASPDPSLRILTPQKLDELKNAVRTLAKGIAQSGFQDVVAIGRQLEHLHLTGDKIVARYTEPFVMER